MSLRIKSAYLYPAVFALVVLAAVYFFVRGVIGEKELGLAGLAMIGSYVGALFAFRLAESKDSAKSTAEKISALNRALFVVARQYNAVKSLNQNLELFKSDFDRAFNCPAFNPPTYSDLVHDFDSLGFVLAEGEPDLLLRLSVEQEGFHQALESLRVRNAFYVGEVQVAVSKQGLNGKKMTLEQFSEALGERLFGGAMQGSRVVYSHVNDALKGLHAIHGELFRFAKRLYPESKFLMPDEEKHVP